MNNVTANSGAGRPDPRSTLCPGVGVTSGSSGVGVGTGLGVGVAIGKGEGIEVGTGVWVGKGGVLAAAVRSSTDPETGPAFNGGPAEQPAARPNSVAESAMQTRPSRHLTARPNAFEYTRHDRLVVSSWTDRRGDHLPPEYGYDGQSIGVCTEKAPSRPEYSHALV